LRTGAEVKIFQEAQTRFVYLSSMNFRSTIFISLLGLVSLTSALHGSDAVDADSTLKPLEFLSGGVWVGQLPPMPDGHQLSLATTFTWMENKQALRFDTMRVAGEKRSGYSSGIYGWHPGRKAIVFWYFDDKGTLYEGTVTVEGHTLVHDFTATDKQGKLSAYRARIEPDGANAYTNTIFAQQSGTWTQLVSVRYERK